MTIGEARAQYMDSVRQMRQEQFREAQTDAAYNNHLLQEYLQAEEQIAVERAEQEALLDSYHSARKGRLERWRYRMQVRRLRPPTKRLAKRGMKRARRCLARPRTRQRTMPAPTSPRSAAVDEALLR